MAKQIQKTWQAKVNNAERTFTLDVIPAGKESGLTLSADGAVLLKAPRKWLPALFGIDYDLPFNLDGQELRLIVSPNYKKADIVSDGRYLSNGKKYAPLPKWIWAFLIPILPLIFLGGAFGALSGILGFVFCQKAAKSSLKTPIRVIICIGIMALAFALYFGIAVVLQMVIKW